MPENLLIAACLAVMQHAILQCRFGNWHSTMSPEQTADLMDAIHNIPALLGQPEYINANWLRASLEAYDRKWSGEPALCDVFDAALR